MSVLHEIFLTAQDYYQSNGYSSDEPDEKVREDHWHHSLALAVDDLKLNTFEKLYMFSKCIRNLSAEVARLNTSNIKEN